jgi:enoyl-CoA hydratase/carnithine racemase
MTDTDILIEERKGTVARLIMNRPSARNSLSLDMLERLWRAITELGADKSIHVIIIAANGPGFCSGHDLKEITAARSDIDNGKLFFEKTMAKCTRLMMAIVKCPKPVIAQVQGIATAAGCQLVASCDLAIASTEAQFATPGVNIGLFCSTPMVALSRNVPRKVAMQMLLTGSMISAEEALNFGFLNKITSTGNLADETDTLAAEISSKAPLTLQIGKEAFYRQAEMPLKDAYSYASEVMVTNMLAPDAEEGIGAFIEKRTPEWQSI